MTQRASRLPKDSPRVKAYLGLLLGALCLLGCPAATDDSGLPRARGQHIDIGCGWDTSLGAGWQPSRGGLSPLGDSIHGFPADEIDPFRVRIKGNTIRYGYRLSPTQQRAVFHVSEAIHCTIRLVQLRRRQVGEGEQRHRDELSVYRHVRAQTASQDLSDVVEGYILLEFEIPGNGTGTYAFIGLDSGFMILTTEDGP